MDKTKKIINFHNSEIKFYLHFSIEELIVIKINIVPYAKALYWQ